MRNYESAERGNGGGKRFTKKSTVGKKKSQQKMQLEIILRASGPGMPHYYRFSLTNQPTEFLSQAI